MQKKKNNKKKNLEEAFCFSNNSLWIDPVKLSLLRTEYLSSAVTFFTNSLTAYSVINKHGKRAVAHILIVFEPVYHLAC